MLPAIEDIYRLIKGVIEAMISPMEDNWGKISRIWSTYRWREREKYVVQRFKNICRVKKNLKFCIGVRHFRGD